MGSYAADAVWASVEEEVFLDEHRDFLYEDGWGRTPHPYFDSGCFDYDSLVQEERLLNLQLQTMPNTTSNVVEGGHLRTQHNSPKKYLPKMRMLFGMAQQVSIKNRRLSVKQRAWVATNWKGGGDVFERDLKSHGQAICTALGNIVCFLERLE